MNSVELEGKTREELQTLLADSAAGIKSLGEEINAKMADHRLIIDALGKIGLTPPPDTEKAPE
jgi:hypothetical protein